MCTKKLDHDGRNIDDHAQIVDELLDDIIFSSILESQSKKVSKFITKSHVIFFPPILIMDRIRSWNFSCIITDVQMMGNFK